MSRTSDQASEPLVRMEGIVENIASVDLSTVRAPAGWKPK